MDKKYAPIILRLGIGIVVFWFGITQVLDSSAFLGYAPGFLDFLPGEVTTFLFLVGILEVILGLMLLAGLYTRIAALITAIHLFFITISLGYTDVAVRDLGLTAASFVIFLNGHDDWSLDVWRKKREEYVHVEFKGE